MPSDHPEHGELWSLQDAGGREVPAIVADNSLNMITLVSLNGTRIRMPEGRTSLWRFIRNVQPAQSAVCERNGCSNAGFLRYTAPTGYGQACPRHVPIGIELTILEGGIPNDPNWRAPWQCAPIPCPSCKNPDPIEDARPLQNRVDSSTRFWHCILCNFNWVESIAVPEILAIDQVVAVLVDLMIHIDRNRMQVQRIQLPPFYWSLLRAEGRFDDSFSGTGTVPNQYQGHYCELNTALEYPIIHLRRSVPTPVRRLGGQPNRTTVRNVKQQIQKHVQQPDDDDTPILPQTYWSQRKDGHVVEVLRRELASSDATNRKKKEAMVIFRQILNDNPSVALTRKDFLKYYIPYINKNDTDNDEPAIIPVRIGDEWESIHGDVVHIIEINIRTEQVRVQSEGDPLYIPFEQFTGEDRKWRKIVRRTAFERLMEDDAV